MARFRRLEHLGLTMYGQMTAGSWIYIGTQGIVQGLRDLRRGGGEAVRWNPRRHPHPHRGLRRHGRPALAVTLNGGVCLIVDVDPARLHRRVEHRYLDEVAENLDDAVEKALKAKEEKRARSIGVVGNAATVFPSCCAGVWRSTSSPTRPPPTTL